MKNDEVETTIHDDIKAAMSELEAEGTSAPDAVDKLEPTSQERGEDGKFKPKGAKEEDKDDVKDDVKDDKVDKVDKVEKVEKTEAAPLGGDPDKPILSQDKAPSSWTPKAREEWAKLPETARQEILRREEDSVKGIRQLQDQMAPYTQFAQTLEPFIKEAFDNKTDPGQYIGNVMQAERRLRIGTAEERFSSLVEIAEGYGIPLRKIINDAMGQEIIPDPFLNKRQNSIPPEVQRELDESRKFREEMTQTRSTEDEASLQKQIDEFKKDKEFFDDVADDMGLLMGTGRATTLQDAYDKACRLNPDVYELLQERAKQPSLSDKQRAAAKLKGTSSNSAETGNSDFDDDDDTETTVRKAIAAQSGRI
jgi:hypothetical protein